jgi:hypothetical protein
MPRAVRSFLLAVALLLVSAAGAQAATFTVNTTADNAATGGECSGSPNDCSLRQAIDEVNGTSTDDTIVLPAGHYTLTIPGSNSNDDQGDLNINKSSGTVIIDGAGARSTTIDATGLGDRVLSLDTGTATISGVTITGGAAPQGNEGGGIQNFGTLTLTDSTVSGNATASAGGGIANPDDTSMTLIGDTIANNQSSLGGGGVDIDAGTASITNTTIANNAVTNGGGGGVETETQGTVQFTNDTISGNAASNSDGGGVAADGPDTRFVNTIVAGNSAGDASTADCLQSGLTDQGHNLDSTGTCFTPSSSNGDINGNPHLGPLENNGGQTDTMALLDGSPAINAASNAGCPGTDQRGVTRPQPTGGTCDIGAFEALPPVASTDAATGVTETSATLHGTVNPDSLATTYHFEYGTTTAYGSSTVSQSAGSGSSAQAESAGISGLKPGTTYHFRIVATNAVGTSVGVDQTFTTPKGGPVVTTGPAQGVGAKSATLTGSVTPGGSSTTYQFQYGTSKKYGKSTTTHSAGSGTSKVNVRFRVTGLRPGAIYHYRLVATNANGKATGKDRTFKTKAVIADAGLSTSGCMRASSRSVLIRVSSVLGVRTTVKLDGRTIGHGARVVRLRLSGLRAGAHALSVTSTGKAGTTTRTVRFAICRSPTPKFTG